MIVRWLHISDLHECRKEAYHRNATYERIISEVIRHEDKPNFVFITGDLAQSGTQKEYENLSEIFLVNLKKALPDSCRIFMVPGNHDVDRDAAVPPRLWTKDPKQRDIFQEVGPAGARKRREVLLPRFKAYQAFESRFAAWGSDWLASESGSASETVTVDTVTVAIVGINTAWLCQDDGDWGALTPGRTMIDAALREAEKANPDLTVVLGHHPLEAMEREGSSSDGKDVQARLEEANALYLHGHLHDAGKQSIGDPLGSVLAIQAPAAFQAGDSKVSRNGFMWGEADLGEGWVYIKPLKWDGPSREYKFDGFAGRDRDKAPGRETFRLPLPGRNGPRVGPVAPVSQPTGWDGWRVIDHRYLATLTSEDSDVTAMIDYFDGTHPDWSIVLNRKLGRRQIVEQSASRFRKGHSGARLPLAELLTGAGGEGKSTALLQVAALLLRDTSQRWTCLYREATTAPAPDGMLENLKREEGHAWIVAVDDAEPVSRALADQLQRIAPRTDVHLLLAAREADWFISGPKDDTWVGLADFRRRVMPALDEADARTIAAGWYAHGLRAVGRLSDKSFEEAAKVLVGYANDHPGQRGAGALLGALLYTRQGEELKSRVRGFVGPLKDREPIKTFDLRDIYAMIAAMHAENQLYLSRPVLTEALGGCGEAELDRALTVLRREAMLDAGTTCITTRHRLIAEAACDVLRDDDYDPDRWYAHLAGSSRRAFLKSRQRVPETAQWNFVLPKYFMEKGGRGSEIAREVAKAVFRAEEKNAHLLTSYAEIIRKTGSAHQALTLFRQHAERCQPDRGLFYEWSVAAGQSGNPALSIWLAGRSLADARESLDPKRCERSLDGLAYAFDSLHACVDKPIFRAAEIACARLGLRVPELADKTRAHFDRLVDASSDASGQNMSASADVDLLRRAVSKAADEVDPSDDPAWLERVFGDPSNYLYATLLSLMQSYAKGNPH